MNSARILAAAVIMSAVIMTGCASRSAALREEIPQVTTSSIGQQSSLTPVSADSGATTVAKGKPGQRTSDSIGYPYPQKNGSGKQNPDKSDEVKASNTARLGSIYFDYDSHMLSDSAREILQKNAEILKNNAKLNIRIEGNCDERGSDEYNLALGEKRARAAMQYLITLGTDSGRLSTISYGKEKPFETGHNDVAWALNRRDDFVSIGK